jgi:hypothetical protein
MNRVYRLALLSLVCSVNFAIVVIVFNPSSNNGLTCEISHSVSPTTAVQSRGCGSVLGDPSTYTLIIPMEKIVTPTRSTHLRSKALQCNKLSALLRTFGVGLKLESVHSLHSQPFQAICTADVHSSKQLDFDML